jgi:CheY-like chemotaxis protein
MDPMSLKVLIVEDDEIILELMSDVFTSANVQVEPVGDSQAAATLVEAQRFDGIFLDLHMPKMGGLELTRHIRQSSWNKSTPVIVVTGGCGTETMQSVFEAGATFFLEKPVDRHKLLRLFRVAQGTMAETRRRCIRVPLETPVACESRGVATTTMSYDISEGGMLVEAAGLRPGEQVRLSFQLPTAQMAVTATGLVVREYGQQRAGIQFVSVTQAGRSGIRDYVCQGGS